MAKKDVPRVPSQEDIFEYLSGSTVLTDEKMRLIEEYFADCDADEIDHVRRTFRRVRVLDSWTARSHGVAEMKAQVVSALDEVKRDSMGSSWLSRLKNWRKGLETLNLNLEESIKVIGLNIGGKETLSQIVRSGIEAVVPTSQFEFALATPIPQRRLRSGKTKSLPPLATITIDNNDISVRIIGWPKQASPPMILLVPVNPELRPILKEFPPSQGEKEVLEMKISGVPPSGYLVTIEPMDKIQG